MQTTILNKWAFDYFWGGGLASVHLCCKSCLQFSTLIRSHCAGFIRLQYLTASPLQRNFHRSFSYATTEEEKNIEKNFNTFSYFSWNASPSAMTFELRIWSHVHDNRITEYSQFEKKAFNDTVIGREKQRKKNNRKQTAACTCSDFMQNDIIYRHFCCCCIYCCCRCCWRRSANVRLAALTCH